MRKISVARALTELKTLKSRIDKKISVFAPATVSIGGKIALDKPIAEFNAGVKSDLQSIKDLISEFSTLKTAIISSNAVTEIKVCGDEMTVAEGIAKKESIEFDVNLNNKCRRILNTMTKSVDRESKNVSDRLDALLQVTFNKEATKVKSDEFESVAKPFLENNGVKLVDPLDLLKFNAALDEKIDLFKSEIDIVLSESNAKTMIEV